MGCAERNEFQAPPPPSVIVDTPFVGDVTVYQIMTGQVDAVESVKITARVQGFLQSVDFQAGSLVEKGQLLFTIEPDEYEAALEAAQGSLSSAIAKEKLESTTYARKQQLYANEAISELDLLASKADLDLASGRVEEARAAVRNAELNLGYTKIHSPIDGRIGRDLINVGNLVGAPGSSELTTVVAIDPAYVYFTVDERELLHFLKKGERADTDRSKATKVSLVLTDGEVFPHEGHVDFAGNVINRETGTLEVRAVFPNPDGTLIAGMFANVRFADVQEKAIVVPDACIQRDLAGDYVYTVGPDNVVSRQAITKGPLVAEGRIVEDGLKADSRVIVSGVQRARPGAPVTPTTEEASKPSA